MTTSRLISFLAGLGIFFLINLLMYSLTAVQLTTWQFHAIHGIVGLVVGILIELLYRMYLKLRLTWSFSNNIYTRQFWINIAIWSALAPLVWYDMPIPNSNLKLLLYSFVSYLTMSALITIFNLLTQRRMQ